MAAIMTAIKAKKMAALNQHSHVLYSNWETGTVLISSQFYAIRSENRVLMTTQILYVHKLHMHSTNYENIMNRNFKRKN